MRWLRLSFLVLGIGALGFYGYTLADEHVYQAYENWAFEQQIAGFRPVTFADYLRAKTSLAAFPAGDDAVITARAPENHAAFPVAPLPPPALGSMLGRVEVPRLHLSAIVREGSDAATLSRAVGHVPSTGLAGQDGNFAIAAHRDTLFRALQGIQLGDIVSFQTTSAHYQYQVFSTRVVKPSEVSVLRPNAGLSADVLNGDGNPRQLLTMITCYPFRFIGSAPQRFIVTARLRDTSEQTTAEPSAPLKLPFPKSAAQPMRRTRVVSHPPVRLQAKVTAGQKHRSLWHRISRTR